MEKFFDYFDERYRQSVLSSPASEDGPVITISRLTGCDARETASLIVEKLNSIHNSTLWKWVDKDIIFSIAKELNIDTQRVESYYKGLKLSNLSEMIMAFSGGFVSDLRVKKAIKDVVLSICKEGHIVLVGRGGVSIAHNVRDSLHVRLVAPFEWRVGNVMRKKEMSKDIAQKFVIDTDEKRDDLIRTFMDKKVKNIESLFDVTMNRQTFSIPVIADLVVSMYSRKMVEEKAEREKIKSLL
ncbi:MAG: cytidylate kinase-like family protein [Bacteroidales bacterium]|nr:cytidylate kinase-like family protein [Bacteroidales bacterium]